MKLDVQVISATNADLKDKVRKGEFRQDLFYRLKVVEIHLPTLIERRDDIPLLVSHFLSLLKKRFHKEITTISPEVEKIFMGYTWPGNVRELIHTLEHAFVVCRTQVIGVEDLPPEIRDQIPGEQQPENTTPMEREEIMDALKWSGWNKAKAAKYLGISRQTIYRKMKEFHIPGADDNM